MIPLATRYLENEQATYESCVRNGQLPSGYITAKGETKIDERALHRSTLWRLVGYLGALTVSLQLGLDVWQQHHPSSVLHRFTGTVPPRKYRTPQRAETLRVARRLLHLQTHWDRTFPERFFPRFATKSADP